MIYLKMPDGSEYNLEQRGRRIMAKHINGQWSYPLNTITSAWAWADEMDRKIQSTSVDADGR